MDATDLRIISLLARNGRAMNSDIARRVDVSEGTIRLRLRRLIDSRVLKIEALVNTERTPGPYLAVIGLSIEGRQLEKCAEQINRFREVQRTLIVTGRYDILVTLLLDSHYGLVDFVTHKLSRIPGIRNSETFVCLKNYDPWFPATCLDRSAKASPGPMRRRPGRKGEGR
jgi:Lrp/AsnC family transcriptional regulator for asnA, asnC and gidA